VHEALPGSYFNSLLLNRYSNGSDYVSWHADDELLYGPTPEIASVTLGCEREFLLRKKPTKSRGKVHCCCLVVSMARTQYWSVLNIYLPAVLGSGEGAQKRQKVTQQQHSFLLKHGSLLVMRGYTQRDWHHSLPKRAKASSPRINLTFRRVLTETNPRGT
jgi:DNA oxidative demethylase